MNTRITCKRQVARLARSIATQNISLVKSSQTKLPFSLSLYLSRLLNQTGKLYDQADRALQELSNPVGDSSESFIDQDLVLQGRLKYMSEASLILSRYNADFSRILNKLKDKDPGELT
jgi:hypothetical protein